MTKSKMLNYLLGTTSKVEILRVLYESDDAMTGRRIAATAGISPRSCQLSLDSLVSNKALFRKAVGRAYSYTLNKDHRMIWDLLQPVFEQESGIHREAAQQILKLCRKHSGDIVSIFWRFQRQRKSESVTVVLVVKQKKGFPDKELIKNMDEMIARRYGYAFRGEVVQVADFVHKYAGSEAARKRFSRDFEKVKGTSLADLLDTPKTPGK